MSWVQDPLDVCVKLAIKKRLMVQEFVLDLIFLLHTLQAWNRIRASNSGLNYTEDGITSFQLFLCGLAAGTCAKLVCHPLDVVKKRFQVDLLPMLKSLLQHSCTNKFFLEIHFDLRLRCCISCKFSQFTKKTPMQLLITMTSMFPLIGTCIPLHLLVRGLLASYSNVTNHNNHIIPVVSWIRFVLLLLQNQNFAYSSVSALMGLGVFFLIFILVCAS